MAPQVIPGGPNFYSFRPRPIDGDVINEIVKGMRAEGATWFRYTGVKDGVWIEGWREQPDEDPLFNPPMTHAQ